MYFPAIPVAPNRRKSGMPKGSCEPVSMLLLLAAFVMAAGTTVRFGALTDDPVDLSALRLAVEYVNENNLVPSVTLEYTENSTDTLAFFDMIRQGCVQASKSIVAVIGPRLSSQVKATSPVSSGLSLPQIAPDATDPTLDNLRQFPMLLRMSWPDSVLGVALVDLVEHFGWDHVSIFVSNDDYGTHGLVEFQLIAGRKGWRVHTMQSFDPTEDPTDIAVTTQLQVIKNTGARIIVLHCLAGYAQQILYEASSLGMTGAGWAWVVSDGITGLDALGGGANGTVPEYLRGLVGPRPPASNGSHGEAFLQKWSSADPAAYPGAGGDTIGVRTT
ncbi:glutamate receptor 3.6-like [Branchiostoma floridae]|uniref:Glutamate receptor 3.6-like n=1 Tax=Branchiostoma floridae TaxID=7739 RepID=A0A9J7KWY0_BRAFL|nr:glutamate receptor 3.6-like [Branchiostoma floridae]